jgi:hypothetical protein
MLRRAPLFVGLVLLAACGAKHVSNVISCGPGTTQTGDVCLPADTTGRLVCGAGTHEDQLACLPDASPLSCGDGTERQGTECVALDATLYDIRLPTLEIPADGYSKIPILALGRLADGTPAIDSVVFGVSRPNAGGWVEATATLTPIGVVGYFVPCNSALTPTCTGTFTATLALASAPATLVARSVEATLVAPSGVGSTAACLTGGNVLFVDGDVGDSVHPGIDTITLGVFTGTEVGGSAPTRVTIDVAPNDAGQGTLWTATFSTEALGTSLVAQVYDDAQRVDYTSPSHPGMEVIEAAATCNALSGRFEVHELTITSGTTVTAFTATFEQACEPSGSNPPVLRGCVHFAQ